MSYFWILASIYFSLFLHLFSTFALSLNLFPSFFFIFLSLLHSLYLSPLFIVPWTLSLSASPFFSLYLLLFTFLCQPVGQFLHYFLVNILIYVSSFLAPLFRDFQDSIAITTLQEQTLNDKLLGNLRRKSCNPIKVRGAVGKHSMVINGIFEPSPTELCGGWPVYYNNTSVHLQEQKSGWCKSPPMRTLGGGGPDTVDESEATKSFLLFCPYAMSWAITVLASVNDPSSCQEDEVNKEFDSSSAGVNMIKNNKMLDRINDNMMSDGKSEVQVSSATTSPFSTTTLSIPSKTSAKKAAVVPFYTPSAAPLTLAFFEVTANTHPELAQCGANTWKVRTVLYMTHCTLRSLTPGYCSHQYFMLFLFSHPLMRLFLDLYDIN